MPFDITAPQVLLVLAVALLALDPRRLPELGRGLGRGLRDFRAGLRTTDPDVATPPGNDASVRREHRHR